MRIGTHPSACAQQLAVRVNQPRILAIAMWLPGPSLFSDGSSALLRVDEAGATGGQRRAAPWEDAVA